MFDFHWMTGVSNEYTMAAAETDLYGMLGVLLGPGTNGQPGAKANYATHIPRYTAWGMDNGCYSNAGAFEERPWLDRLEWLIENVDHAADRCRFAVAPDVFDPSKGCGDPIATIERSLPVLPKIRDCGAPAALVFQDGLHLMDHDLIPWDDFDVAFIGGGDHFKLCCPHNWKAGDRDIVFDRYAEDTLAFARLMHRCYTEGKDVHVGRVNTQVRMRYSYVLGAATCDGTMIARAGTKGLERMQRWLGSLYEESMEAMQTA